MHPRFLVPVMAMAALLMVQLVACAHTQGGFTQHYGDTLFEVAENRAFSVELLQSAPLGIGVNSLQMVVHDRKDKDVEGAKVRVRAYPAGKEQDAGVYEASDLGHGLYSVHQVSIDSPGDWVLAIDVAKGKESGTALFNFPKVTAQTAPQGMQQAAPQAGGHAHGHGDHGHGGHAQGAAVGEPKETGRSVESARGLYRVSYEPRGGSIPVGKVHAWELKVADATGKPVKGATVIVDGEMPEHRHGLPTKPEAAEAANGTYVVQGMKFNMPGWWILRFHVFTEEQRDTAEFHLILK
jgi:hypothetical protein